MSTTKSTSPEKTVTRIIGWEEIEADIISVEAYLADDSYWSGIVDAKTWLRMQEEELSSDIMEANSQRIIVHRQDMIDYYKENNDHFGLCAWCHTFWNRHTEKRHSAILTDDQYIRLSSDGETSHGCCPQCAAQMTKEVEESRLQIAPVEESNNRFGRKTIVKVALVLLAAMLLLASCPSDGYAFDPPDCGDPWYYQTDDAGIMFVIPDKIQHYWGSYGLSKLASNKMGPIPSALTAFAIGFAWEIKDSYTDLGTANGGVVGFSTRDLIADGLGVLSAQLSNDNIRFYADYSTQDEQVMFNASFSF